MEFEKGLQEWERKLGDFLQLLQNNIWGLEYVISFIHCKCFLPLDDNAPRFYKTDY